MKISTVFNFCIITGVLVFASVVHAQATRGIPGVDYPNYHSLPKTSFSCSEQKYIPGFYADSETQCQVFHFCFKDRQESFLCPTGTIFNQEILACDSWYSSNCSLAPLFYNVNAGPAMEGAGRNLPMLIKLRNRSQGKSSMPTSTPNIFEKISSIYEASTDITTPTEGLETSSFSGDLNYESSANVSSGKSSEVSLEAEAAEDKNYQFSEEALAGVDLQGDESVEEDETYAADFESMSEEVDEEMNTNLMYDPIAGGYYMNYNPYQTEWQQDSEPISDEFKSFYDYERMGNEYGIYNDDSNDGEMLAESLPEGLDLSDVEQDITDETVFSKRNLEVEKSTRRYRRRPMYVVVEDNDENETDFPIESEGDGYLGDEAGLLSSDHSTSEDESSTEIPEGETEETSENEGPEVSEEELKRLQFPYRRVYATQRPLTSEEFGHLILTELVVTPDYGELSDEAQSDSEEVTSIPSEYEQIYKEEASEDLTYFQGDDQVNIQDSVADQKYETDSSAYDLDAEKESSVFYGKTYEESELNPWYQTNVVEPEVSDEDTDDTFVVIPDESDDVVPNTSSVDDSIQYKTGDEDSENEYTYEESANEETDADSQGDAGYEDAYEYYRSHRELPEGYEFLESTSYQGSEFDYLRRYEEQYMPDEIYNANIGYEEARRPFWPSGDDSYSYMRQQYQPTSYVDPIYETESGYFRDDFSQNPYIVDGETSNYYTSDEASQYYSESDTPWIQQDSSEDVEMENRLGVTDIPISSDITDDFVNLDEISNTGARSGEDSTDFATEDEIDNQTEDTFYVFDFDEEGESDDKLPEIDYSEQLEEKETSETEDLMQSDSTSNDNVSFYKDGTEISSEFIKAEKNDFQSFDAALSSQNGNTKSDISAKGATAFNMNQMTGTWSPLAAEGSRIEEPVTLTSALERLVALNAVKAPQLSGVSNMDFPSDTRFLNNMEFPESMDFGPYGYGGQGQQYSMVNSIPPSKGNEALSNRDGELEQAKFPKLSSLQERLRSMKQGKFGAFKKYMSSMKNKS